MPAAKPPEFRRRALELVAMGEPVAQVAKKGLGISEGTLRRWMAIDAVDSAEGSRPTRCTLSAHHHLLHSNTIHAKPHLFTGIRNVS
jgi:transposase-like protein